LLFIVPVCILIYVVFLFLHPDVSYFKMLFLLITYHVMFYCLQHPSQRGNQRRLIWGFGVFQGAGFEGGGMCHLSLPAPAQVVWSASSNVRRRRHLPANMPALGMAAPPCHRWPRRHVPRVAWPDVPPPLGVLFDKYFCSWSFLTLHWCRWSDASKIPQQHIPLPAGNNEELNRYKSISNR
jgi:hypothetical protein